MNQEQNQAQAWDSEPRRNRSAFSILVESVKRWMFLNIWCSHLYRPTMRLLHRFNLHYAPPSPMSPKWGEQNHWCQWCGLHGKTWKYNPDGPLMPIEDSNKELARYIKQPIEDSNKKLAEYIKQKKKQCGFISAITSRFELIPKELDRYMIQKMVFLLQEVYHVDAGYSFGFNTFGPFSSGLLRDLETAENCGVIIIESSSGEYGGGIKPGERIEEYLTDASEFLEANNHHISNLVSAFGVKSAKELELLTTIIYLDKETRRDTDKMTREEAVKAIRELKPRFTDKDIFQGMVELENTHKVELAFL